MIVIRFMISSDKYLPGDSFTVPATFGQAERNRRLLAESQGECVVYRCSVYMRFCVYSDSVLCTLINCFSSEIVAVFSNLFVRWPFLYLTFILCLVLLGKTFFKFLKIFFEFLKNE